MEGNFLLVPNNLLPQEPSCKVPSTTNWAKFRKLLSYCLFPETLLSLLGSLLGFQLPACLLCCSCWWFGSCMGAQGGLSSTPAATETQTMCHSFASFLPLQWDGEN